jgi:serine/threonine protein phosphatase PrpC
MVPRRTRLDVETWAFRLKPGDLVLVCSDGITGAFGKSASTEILRILTETLGAGWANVIRSEAALAAAVRSLVREADERGGRDNLTAVIVSIGPYCDEMEGADM